MAVAAHIKPEEVCVPKLQEILEQQGTVIKRN